MIETTGVGRVAVTANRLRLALGVEARAPGAADALQALWTRLAALQRVLDEHAVAATDRQTSSLSLGEAFRNDGAPAGYQAACQVSVTLADTDRAVACLDALLAAVGDAVRLHHTAWVTDPARQLARAAGVTLGPLRLLREGAAGAPPPFPDALMAARALSSMPAMEAGETLLTVVVEAMHDIE